MDNLARKMEDGERTEMLNGKITAMSPRPSINHNTVSDNITVIFKNFLKGKPCKAYGDGVDVFLSEQDRVVPDAMIVCNQDRIQRDGIHGAPDLVVEVLSPSTAKNDRGLKKELYRASGVREYWIVDTAGQSIEVYLLQDGAYILDEVYSVYPEYMLEKMSGEERQAVKTEFTASILPELPVKLEDVFEGTI